MNWHLDNNSYRLDEIEVIQKCRVIENVAGDCIIHGVLRHITCYKWPFYRDGVIIGLMGVFFEADDMYRKLHQSLPSTYEDPITSLHNRQGFLGDLLQYQETRRRMPSRSSPICSSSLRAASMSGSRNHTARFSCARSSAKRPSSCAISSGRTPSSRASSTRCSPSCAARTGRRMPRLRRPRAHPSEPSAVHPPDQRQPRHHHLPVQHRPRDRS